MWRYLRQDIGARGWVLLTAIALDMIVLAAFATIKWQGDPLIVVIALVGMTTVFLFERVFLALNPPPRDTGHDDHDAGHEHRGHTS